MASLKLNLKNIFPKLENIKSIKLAPKSKKGFILNSLKDKENIYHIVAYPFEGIIFLMIKSNRERVILGKSSDICNNFYLKGKKTLKVKLELKWSKSSPKCIILLEKLAKKLKCKCLRITDKYAKDMNNNAVKAQKYFLSHRFKKFSHKFCYIKDI